MITTTNFETYDAAHPLIWESFCSVVAEYRAGGFERWSAETVLHNVRRQARTDVNIGYAPYYASKWTEQHPEARSFFEPQTSA